MKYIKEIHTAQIDINKSIFIGVLLPLTSKDEVKDQIEKVKLMYPKATHYCHGSLFGEQHEHQTASDDGEPQRTAGIPILEVLKRHDVTDLLCVVVRFYGGIKLGAPGLIRAYSKATALVLNEATYYEKRWMKGYQITFAYSLISKIDYMLETDAIIENKTFEKDVSYDIYFKTEGINLLDDLKHQVQIKPLENKRLWLKL